MTNVTVMLKAEPDLAEVDVHDGPPFTWDPLKTALPQYGDGRRFLFVGALPDTDDGDSAKGQQQFGGTGGAARSRDERFTVNCTAVVLDGGEDVPAVRGELFAMLAVVERVLLFDPTLNDAVLYSEFAGVDSHNQFFTDQGLTERATFDIACRAYLTS
jgi:hypothetical protein